MNRKLTPSERQKVLEFARSFLRDVNPDREYKMCYICGLICGFNSTGVCDVELIADVCEAFELKIATNVYYSN